MNIFFLVINCIYQILWFTPGHAAAVRRRRFHVNTLEPSFLIGIFNKFTTRGPMAQMLPGLNLSVIGCSEP